MASFVDRLKQFGTTAVKSAGGALTGVAAPVVTSIGERLLNLQKKPPVQRFGVGEGLSNVTEVLPGPRLQAAQALARGEEVKATPTPVRVSQVSKAKEVFAKEPLAPKELRARVMEPVKELARPKASFSERLDVLDRTIGQVPKATASLAQEALFRPAASIALGTAGLLAGEKPGDVSLPIPKATQPVLGERPLKPFGQESVEFVTKLVESRTGRPLTFDFRSPAQATAKLSAFIPLALIGSAIEFPGLPGKKKIATSYIDNFLKSQKGFELLETMRIGKEALKGSPLDNALLVKAIKNTPHYQKEKGVADWMAEGIFVRKGGRVRLTTGTEYATTLRAKGWVRDESLGGVDALAQQAGYAPEKSMNFLEDVLNTTEKKFKNERALAHEYLLKNDPEYARLVRGGPESRTLLPPEATAQFPGAQKQILSEVPEELPPVKERGFLETLRNSTNVDPRTKALVENLPDDSKFYSVYTDKEAVQRAQARLDTDEAGSIAFIFESENIDKDVVATAIEAMRRYRKAGNYEMPVRIYEHLAKKGTTAGQAIQALSLLDTLGPEGVLHYATKKITEGLKKIKEAPGLIPRFKISKAEKAVERAGGLSKELTEEIVKKAEEIEQMEYGWFKMKKVGELHDLIDSYTPKTGGEKALNFLDELFNSPRAIMAGSLIDFSFMGRQGNLSVWRSPKNAMSAFIEGFKGWRSDELYDEAMNEIVKHKRFNQAVQDGVSFTDVNAKLNLREDRYRSSLAEKIPLLGRNIKANNRAYTLSANKLRMEEYARLMDSFEARGPVTAEQRKQLASLVNNMTGRGDLPTAMKNSTGFLNAIFFSPRLMASRLQMLNPVNYVLTSPEVRKEYWKTAFSYVAGTTTLLGLASLHPAITVGTDWRSADFGKIKVGNTRFDISAGFQPYVRFFGQMKTGQYVSSSTGKIITLGEGYKPLTKFDILLRFLESKESPLASFVSTILKQQSPTGEDVSIPKELQNRVTSMIATDIYDVIKDNPWLTPIVAPFVVFGGGVQTYAPPEAYQKLEEIRKSTDPASAYLKLKKENPKLAQKVDRAGVQSTFNEFDWSLTYLGVENGKRAQFLFEYFNKLPTTEAKSALWRDLKKKKLLSKEVIEQINFLNKSSSPSSK